jgi:hypothetical protein
MGYAYLKVIHKHHARAAIKGILKEGKKRRYIT